MDDDIDFDGFDVDEFVEDLDERQGIYNLRANRLGEVHLYNNSPPIEFNEKDE